MAKGKLIVNVYAGTVALPVMYAIVEVEGTDIKVETDKDGATPVIELDAPNLEYSEQPQEDVRPYSTYDIKVSKLGMVPQVIKGVEIYPDITSVQNVFLNSVDDVDEDEEIVDIEPPTLWGDYAPTIEDEEEEKTPSITPFVLPRVIVPEYIIVHDGTPSNTNAANYYVNFSDYIKNVASSEIYPTWPEESLRANILAIISFTLNRLYTEWYRSKGYDFTITSTTSYDQKYTPGRTIFDSISVVVDDIFNQYIKAGTINAPYLAHYNDGIKVNNSGWLSQWGSKDLADKGYNAEQILKYYYGSNLTFPKAEIAGEYPTSFPGYNLKLGSCGEEVQKLQNEINKIRGNYPGLYVISNPDGKYDEETVNAVKRFQSVFKLPVTGIIDFATWYKISYLYTAVTGLANSVYG